MTRLRSDTGNAMVEFTFLGVLLFVPLVYLVLAVLDVQRASYGASAAVREAGPGLRRRIEHRRGRAPG